MLLKIIPKLVAILLLHLGQDHHHTISEPVSQIISEIPGSCPVQPWIPPSNKLTSTLVLPIIVSGRYLEDSVVFIEPDFTIHRPQSFSEGCTYNLTYKWDEEQQKFLQLPISEGGPKLEVIVLMDQDLSLGAIYDCKGPEPSIGEFKKEENGNLTITLYEKFGLSRPVMFFRYKEKAAEREYKKQAIKRCKLRESVPKRFDNPWFILGAFILLFCVALFFFCKLI